MQTALTQQNPILTIPVFSGLGTDWEWYAKETRGKVRWDFHTEQPKTLLERIILRPTLSRALGAFQCVSSARHLSSTGVAALSQYNTMWTAFALRLLGVRVPRLLAR